MTRLPVISGYHGKNSNPIWMDPGKTNRKSLYNEKTGFNLQNCNPPA
jgi:hypothetical protein